MIEHVTAATKKPLTDQWYGTSDSMGYHWRLVRHRFRFARLFISAAAPSPWMAGQASLATRFIEF